MNAVHYSSARHDWRTPPDLFAKLDQEFGFTLDAAASDENALCNQYYTEAEDGLAQDFGRETVWINPPYGRAVAAWVEKGWTASRQGATVVMLVPARTDTAWWHRWVMQADEIRFLRGRRLSSRPEPRPAGANDGGGMSTIIDFFDNPLNTILTLLGVIIVTALWRDRDVAVAICALGVALIIIFKSRLEGPGDAA